MKAWIIIGFRKTDDSIAHIIKNLEISTCPDEYVQGRVQRENCSPILFRKFLNHKEIEQVVFHLVLSSHHFQSGHSRYKLSIECSLQIDHISEGFTKNRPSFWETKLRKQRLLNFEKPILICLVDCLHEFFMQNVH